MPKFQPEVENYGKFVQKPTSFDASTVWEAYYAQFEIVSKLNNWNDYQKAAYLATSLKVPALAVLGNLAPENRQNLEVLVSALGNRFGSSHQTDLSRVRFKNRVKQRDESLPEMSEDIERLSRLAYPDTPLLHCVTFLPGISSWMPYPMKIYAYVSSRKDRKPSGRHWKWLWSWNPFNPPHDNATKFRERPSLSLQPL